MGNYTPAPWWFTEDIDETYTIGQGDVYFCTVHQNQLKPYTKFGIFDKGDKKANARLIACAPELLEALENLVRGVPNTWPAAIDAKKIISKAKGEQHG
jgi:hypothetical protein